jgi:molybdenum ABC transporter, periplasmic molybdate-binding protein
METPRKLAEKQLVEQPVRYATGVLIVFSTRKLPFEKGVGVVSLPEVKTIAVANPALAPYGKAAIEAIEKSGLSDTVKKKLVYANNISETAHFSLTAADLGFIALSLMGSDELKKYDKKGTYWQEIDPGLYSPIEQGVSVITASAGKPGAVAFRDFVLSDAAKKIFAANGYGK